MFKTQRSRIRPFQWTDYQDLISMMTDADVMQFTGFRIPQTEEKIKEFLEKWIAGGKDRFGVWAAEEIANSDFIGWFMLKKTTTEDPELGFMLPKEKWRQGYATEIAQGFIQYAFHNIGVKRVIASVDQKNLASISVLKKIGMSPSEIVSNQDGIIYFEVTDKLS